MSRFSSWKKLILTEEAKPEPAPPLAEDPRLAFRWALLATLLWEGLLRDPTSSLSERLAERAAQIPPAEMAAAAVDAREKLRVRWAALFLTRELARRRGAGPLVAATLERIVRRADDITDFIALYWAERKQPLTAGIKRGLANAFRNLDAYRLARYDPRSAVRLRDVLFLVHPKPRDAAQAVLWKKLADGKLPPAGELKDALAREPLPEKMPAEKLEWETLLRAGKVRGRPLLRHLGEILDAGVDDRLLRAALRQPIRRERPFAFLRAAKLAPRLADALNRAMLGSAAGLPSLAGPTGLLIDVSRSMHQRTVEPRGLTAVEAAAGIAIELRERAEQLRVATFSSKFVELPPHRGLALRDAILHSQRPSDTELRRAFRWVAEKRKWWLLERLIVMTDEPAYPALTQAFTPFAFVNNLGTNRTAAGVAFGWVLIDGWSERLLDFIPAVEAELRRT